MPTYTEEELLKELTRLANGRIGPSAQDMREEGKYSAYAYQYRFRSWWQAVVQAGLIPSRPTPLTDDEFNRYFEAAVKMQNPLHKLPALLLQFTGLTMELGENLCRDWVTKQPHGMLVEIPPSETKSGDWWEFKLPAKWGDGKETDLPGLVDWCLDSNETVPISYKTYRRSVYRAADRASIERETVQGLWKRDVPSVHPRDVQAAGGIRMARNGAPSKRIRRHLGIEHTEWDVSVEDFFLWLYVHDGFVHPEYTPPDLVLDPVES